MVSDESKREGPVQIKTRIDEHPIVKIAAIMEGRFSDLNDKFNAGVNALRIQGMKEIEEAERVAVLNIAKELAGDKTENGKNMRDILSELSAKGEIKSYGLPVGMWDLKEAKLVRTDVSPSSLYADIDTYETDPTTFVLTETGRKVTAKLLEIQSGKALEETNAAEDILGTLFRSPAKN